MLAEDAIVLQPDVSFVTRARGAFVGSGAESIQYLVNNVEVSSGAGSATIAEAELENSLAGYAARRATASNVPQQPIWSRP